MTALPLLALLLPSARSADEPKPITIKGEGFLGLSFSPDGKTLAVGTRFDGVELRDTKTGKKLSALKWYGVRGDVAFSPDGKLLASVGWDRSARRLNPAKLASFSERTLAMLCYEEVVRIWDVETGKVKVRLHDSDTLTVLAFSPDGKRVAAGGDDGGVRVWDISAEKVTSWSRETDGNVSALAFSPDGKKVAVGTRKGPIYVLNSATGGTIATLDEHTRPVLALAFAADGQHLHSAGSNGGVRRWNMKAGTTAELTAIKHYTEFSRMTFSPDRRWLAAGDERGTVTVWEASTGEQHLDFYDHKDPISCLAFSPDGKQLASGIQRFDYKTGDFTSTLTLQPLNLSAKK